MKKSVLFLIASLAIGHCINAQARFGIRAGLSTDNLDRETIATDGFKLAIKEAKYGYHLGIFFRANLGETFYLQPEVLFNSNSVDFTLENLSEGLPKTVFNERYNNLDLPVMVGLKLVFLRLQAGPVGHVHLKSKSELDDVDGVRGRFSDFKLGYQAGVGIDLLKRLLIDVKYEGNFSKFGDHIEIAGEDVKFSQNPSRWLLTLGFAF
jgi:hypothetical protein